MKEEWHGVLADTWFCFERNKVTDVITVKIASNKELPFRQAINVWFDEDKYNPQTLQAVHMTNIIEHKLRDNDDISEDHWSIISWSILEALQSVEEDYFDKDGNRLSHNNEVLVSPNKIGYQKSYRDVLTEGEHDAIRAWLNLRGKNIDEYNVNEEHDIYSDIQKLKRVAKTGKRLWKEYKRAHKDDFQDGHGIKFVGAFVFNNAVRFHCLTKSGDECCFSWNIDSLSPHSSNS